jgi:hypothetical protein
VVSTRHREEDDRITPKPAVMRALQNQNWTTHGALAELIDNGWGAGRGDATTVVITWDPRSRLLTVLDNGVGMVALKDLFQLGKTVGRTPNDIGEFGSGGTMAIVYLASHVDIWTLRDRQVAHAFLHWDDVFKADDFPLVPTVWKSANPKNTPEALRDCGHGTYVQLKVLRRRRVSESQIRRDLSALFAPGVRNGKQLIWVTAGQPPIALGDPLQALTNSVIIDLTLEILATTGPTHFHVAGEVGVIDELPIERSRVAISYAHRVLKWTRDCYRHSDGRSYPAVGVCGWIHLDDSWQGLYTTTKDDIDDADAFQALMDAIFVRIEPLLKQLKNRREHLLLDQVSLELQQMFVTGRHTTPAAFGELDEDGNVVGPGGRGGGGGSHGRHRRREGATPGGMRRAISKLEIIRVSEKEMRGILSRAEVCYRNDDTLSVDVFVNEDHRVITLALEQHPINRMALAILVADAVGYQICVHPRIVREWFGPKVTEHLETLTKAEQGAFVVRLLMDRFHYEARH